MSLTIGRVDVDDTYECNWDGDRRVSLSGEIIGSSLAEAKAMRQQFLGLADVARGETVIPVTWSEDSELDGFYRLASTPKVTSVQTSLVTFTFEWSLELERVDGGFQLPAAESYVVGGERTGIGGSVTETYWHAVPSDFRTYDYAASAISASFERTGPGGSAKVLRGNQYSGTYVRWRLKPADWYDVACTIKVGGYEVVGSAIPATANITDWEIGNGLIKATDAGSSTTNTFQVVGAASTASNWSAVDTAYTVGRDSGAGWVALAADKIKGIEVIRNQPWCCVLRLWLGFSLYTNDGNDLAIDLRIRRGSYIIEGVIASNGTPASHKWGIERTGGSTHLIPTDVGGITNGGGLRPDADDADGNRWCLMTGTSTGSSTWATGRMIASSVTAAMDFGLAYERAGASSADPNRAADLRDQYFATQDEAIHIGIAR